jgi:hypothetical protein
MVGYVASTNTEKFVPRRENRGEGLSVPACSQAEAAVAAAAGELRSKSQKQSLMEVECRLSRWTCLSWRADFDARSCSFPIQGSVTQSPELD